MDLIISEGENSSGGDRGIRQSSKGYEYRNPKRVACATDPVRYLIYISAAFHGVEQEVPGIYASSFMDDPGSAACASSAAEACVSSRPHRWACEKRRRGEGRWVEENES